ncbi:MAG: hypothetical protein NTZ05_14780, partial [Chloroflexi bacterium]|nr:hypothetical protein [Chloroflexota bacterium]
MMAGLWDESDAAIWRAALERYPATAAVYGSARLTELDEWVRRQWTQAVAARPTPFVTHQEMVWATEWKMLRGVWRARNLQLVRSNAEDEVQRLSGAALAAAP